MHAHAAIPAWRLAYHHRPTHGPPSKTVYAALRLRKTATRREPYLLVWHKPALILAALTIACYVTTIAAKEDAALQTLFLLRKVGRAYLFPFVRPALDTVGLFMLLTVASIVYGSCKQEPESFKVCGECLRDKEREERGDELRSHTPPAPQNNESTKQWAAFTAYVHVLLSYPIIIANFQVRFLGARVCLMVYGCHITHNKHP